MLRIKHIQGLLLGLVWLGATFPVYAASCDQKTHNDIPYTVCTADAVTETLRLFLKDSETDTILGTFSKVDDILAKDGKRLSVAMNAGMYHRNRQPVGLYIEDGEQVTGLVKRAGPGNFGLLPNGVFCIRDGRTDVIETLTYAKTKPDCRYATQSGPMLVIDGMLHPRFLYDSDSRYIRNGIGTSEDGKTVYFTISDRPVTFYEFGTFFRDVLKTPSALYFDGNISRMYDRAGGRSDLGFPLGPIVGVVEDANQD